MPSFSKKSTDALFTCDWHLQKLFTIVIQTYDCTVIEGYRSPERQLKLYEEKKSRVKVSKHNTSPSMAVDVAPYVNGRGIPWPKLGSETYSKDILQFYHFAGYVLGIASELEFRIRWGGDWDKDFDLADQSFNDLVHYELI